MKAEDLIYWWNNIFLSSSSRRWCLRIKPNNDFWFDSFLLKIYGFVMVSFGARFFREKRSIASGVCNSQIPSNFHIKVTLMSAFKRHSR